VGSIPERRAQRDSNPIAGDDESPLGVGVAQRADPDGTSIAPTHERP
jgi:hypothetical protein